MTRDKQVRFWIIGGAVFLGLVYLLGNALTPFVAGMIVAYILDPLADRLEAAGLGRSAATSVITLAFIFLLLGGLLVIIPVLEGQIREFIARWPDYVNALHGKIRPIAETWIAQLEPDQVEQIKAKAQDAIGQAASFAAGLAGKALSGGAALLNIISILVITPVVIFYLLRDWDLMVARIDGWLPRRQAPVIRSLVGQIDQTLSGYARGQATVCLVLAVIYATGLSLIGLEMGLVIGIIAGIISFVPYVGSTSGALMGLGLAFAQFSAWPPIAMVGGLFVVGQILESYVLTPKLVGDKVGLNEIWVMFALLAGGSLFGFVGVLLALPVAAVIGVLLRFGLQQYLESPIYLGEEADAIEPPEQAKDDSPA